jgi:hypothetical protein
MAKYKVANVEFEEETTSVNLSEFPPNSMLVIASDAKGNKKILELNPDKIENKNMISRTAGLCFRPLPGGGWGWVPC